MESAYNWLASPYLLAVGAVLVALLLPSLIGRGRCKLPPGPVGLPFLGNILSLSPPIYRCFANMAKTYGPIMTVWMGRVPNIVVSSAELAKEVLKTHDHVLASRPSPIIAEIMNHPGYDVVWTPLGNQWRNTRKLCVNELLNPTGLSKFLPIRMDECKRLMAAIESAGNGSKPVILRNHLWITMINSFTRMLAGKRYSMDEPGKLDREGLEVKQIVDEALRLGSAFNIGDFIPLFRKLDLQGYEKKLKRFRSRMDGLMADLRKVHEQHGLQQEKENDFLDTILKVKAQYELDDVTIANVLWNMIFAGSDTTVASLEWTMAELLIHPKKLVKAQKEVDSVVGSNRPIEEDDLPKLKYLNWAYKEALRVHPPTAMLLPHLSTEACTIAGYNIPPGTVIHVNAWAISRDPAYWQDPESYLPERYEAEDVDMRGFDFRLLPFGAGRRGCPGIQLALNSSVLLLANLLRKFNWHLPPGIHPQDVDMTEAFGIVQNMNVPISAIATVRL
ncbi:hypothetical protein O6H91_12G103500 [Diphasiastrum complanatum]|uniref:Uncharacterized protein n=2 Tax=Diphasiastrum complanatum TaxID=34168 RepID=A0ACC2C5I5_DIPCM|nr:hypothetical protein O6H91_12G103100 [Diphasiastrum complanatum]KAJ7537220.1 hypothetical protein O6H91_12G103500 [Diphasiastrum complanatum]